MSHLANTAVAHELRDEEVRPDLRVVDPRGAGPSDRTSMPVTNTRIAVAMLLVAESMFFAGLIGAYLVFRVGSVVWPPPGLPALPIGVTWINTIVLLLSGLAMVSALRGIRRGDQRSLQRGLLWSAALGGIFVAVQGSEWVRLVQHGLMLSSGPYGGTFYTLIGTHAAHVGGAILWVFYTVAKAYRGGYSRAQHDGVEMCAVYWLYVCGLWVVLFGMVYH